MKAVPTHLQNPVVWSRILKCIVKSYVIGPSIKCYLNEFPFMPFLTHDKIEKKPNGCEHSECHGQALSLVGFTAYHAVSGLLASYLHS